ncbi:MAG: choice-of-anchor B family protein [Phycisphaerae bacterium]|nr:choice-of-anchor B family protein [Saprospiraceae bacterium]
MSRLSLIFTRRSLIASRILIGWGVGGLLTALTALSLSAQPNLQRIGHLSYGSLSLAGCWHHVDKVGGEWALVGTNTGLSIVNLNDPTQPVERFKVPGPTNNWREVKTWAGYAYIGSEALNSGITIVNLNYLPDSIQWKVWRGDGFFDSLVIKSHALEAEAGYLYICGGTSISNGVVIANLVDPWNPHILSKYAANYVHDAFIRGDTLWSSEIYQGQFGVVDISNRTNPVLLATQPTPGAFNHNTGLSNDSKTLFTTDEKTGAPLASFDVSKLDDIRMLDVYFPSKKPSGEVHNVRVTKGDFLVCPSYRGQLTIVDGSQPDNLIEIAWDSLGLSLVWDADPYLPSGIIFATAKTEGLFIYQPTYTHAAWIQGLVTDANTGFPLSDAKVFVLNSPNADTTGANGVYKTGAAATGSYTLRVERVGYQPQVISNVSLLSGSITSLNFALSPLIIGTENIENEPFLRVSPTPFEDFLRVEFPEGSLFKGETTMLRLSDFSGKSILEKKADDSGITVLEGLKNLPTGTYFLHVVNEKGLNKVIKVAKI